MKRTVHRLLWLGLLLLLARTTLLLATNAARSGDFESALWRLNLVFVRTLAVAYIGAFLGGALLAIVRDRSDLVRLPARAFVAAAFAFVTAGLGHDRALDVPGFESLRGLGGWAVSVSVAIALVYQFSRDPKQEADARWSPAYALIPIGLPLAALGYFSVAPGPRFTVTETVRSLVASPGSFSARGAGDSAPRVGTLTTGRLERDERPALILPPGSECSFVVAEDEAPGRLRTAVGVDLAIRKHLSGLADPLSFRFEVLVNDELVAERTLTPATEPAERAGGYRPIGGPDGIALAAGDLVRLRTLTVSGEHERAPDGTGWKIGFADPLIERKRLQSRTRSSPERPNLVLILMDTQRADRLGCYGYDRPTSPNIDRLAARGVLFERASATSSWTWPSTASVLTGLAVEEHGVKSEESCYLSWNLELVSEVLQRQGFTTALFTGSPLIVPSKNFDQGFEHVDIGKSEFRKSSFFIPDACDWIEEKSGERFFLYLHMTDPHHPHHPSDEARAALVGRGPRGPYNPRRFYDQTWALRNGNARPEGESEWNTTLVVSEDEQRYLSELYDACVATGDRWLGVLMDALAENGLEDETIVAFTSDHGEELFDHGMLEHGHSLYRELIQVPLILAGPGIPEGVRSEAVVSNRHLAPTLALLGGARMEGVRDALDLARPDSIRELPILYSTEHGWWNNWHRTTIYGIRDGNWVLHHAPRAGAWRAPRATMGGETRLYDASSDPEEQDDLSSRESERAQALLERVQSLMRGQRESRTAPSIGAGAETLELLRGIGYIESED